MPDPASSYLEGIRSGEGLASSAIESFQAARSYRDKIAAQAVAHDQAAQALKTEAQRYQDLLQEHAAETPLTADQLEAAKKTGVLTGPGVTKSQQISFMGTQEKIDSAIKKGINDRMKGHFVVSEDDLNNPNLKNYKVGELAPERLKNPEKTEADKAREDKRLDDRVTAMGKDLDPSAFRAGAFGVSKQVFDRSERLESLLGAVDSIQKGDADSRQIEELAIGLNSMLSGSNSGAQETVKSLVPKTVYGDARKLQEWLTNNPTGTGQKEFVKRMRGTIEREAQTAQGQIERTRYERLAKWDDIRKKDPERWDSVARSFEVDPAKYDKWVKGGRKPIQTSTGSDEKVLSNYKDPAAAKKISEEYKAGPQTKEAYDKAQAALEALKK